MAPNLFRKSQKAYTMTPSRFEGTGRVGSLTPQQEVTLQRFKEELAKECDLYDARVHDDHILLRFLRARKFDLPKSLLMFTNYLKWRKDFGVDDLVRNFKFEEHEEVAKYYPRYYHKTDRLDRPIYVEHIGNVDLKQLFKVTTEERMIKHFVVGYESLVNDRFPSCSKLAGQRIEQCFTILDLKGIQLKQAPSIMSFIKRISAIAQDYYPEMMGKMFIINAPYLFASVFNLIKNFLDEVTVNKIVILSGKYQQELLKDVDPENLPTYFGGVCECPGGCRQADLGPWKDPKFNKKLRVNGSSQEYDDSEDESSISR
ncbi:uncharacterized protein VTP21DRAFT_4396 [Calcarisporiella thermophila]|uniref:uncharacterized protein n=1 Tax=Calcarisporiella thermophila TaxID=911321 RepID=UPI0037422104